jgi:hypothetical protein
MSISKLLALSLLITVIAAPVAAQTSPQKSPLVDQATSPGRLQLSGSTHLPALNLNAAPDPANPLGRIHIEEYQPRLDHFVLPPVLRLPSVGEFQDDIVCYAIRSYKVARDDPQSDSTHADGYSTCQPATRFHVNSVRGVIRPEMP